MFILLFIAFPSLLILYLIEEISSPRVSIKVIGYYICLSTSPEKVDIPSLNLACFSSDYNMDIISSSGTYKPYLLLSDSYQDSLSNSGTSSFSPSSSSPSSRTEDLFPVAPLAQEEILPSLSFSPDASSSPYSDNVFFPAAVESFTSEDLPLVTPIHIEPIPSLVLTDSPLNNVTLMDTIQNDSTVDSDIASSDEDSQSTLISRAGSEIEE
jgi:hypothetical protein